MFKPVFDAVEEMDERIAALVYFTDMYACDVDDLIAPEYPVIWAVSGNNNPTVPFGDITAVIN